MADRTIQSFGNSWTVRVKHLDKNQDLLYYKYEMSQRQYLNHYDNLKDKWSEKNKVLQKNLWEKHKEAFDWLSKHAKNAALGSLSSLVLLSANLTVSAPSAFNISTTQQFEKDLDKSTFLIYDLSHLLPDKIEPLSPSQEQTISQTLIRHFGIPITPVLQGKRLNVDYGYIGAEQHLARYPGDTMETHFDNNSTDQKLYGSSGMAPGLGAWRYFASSSAQMTEKDVMRERYYIAVQTFLSDGYNQNVKEYNDFFRFRKMLVVNPQNGKAVIAVIGDAGPGESTGKQFGGSPEVMKYLERVDGAQKGPVLIFFVDDPEDKIPLGPIRTQ